jgi:hypothetical protein
MVSAQDIQVTIASDTYKSKHQPAVFIHQMPAQDIDRPRDGDITPFSSNVFHVGCHLAFPDSNSFASCLSSLRCSDRSSICVLPPCHGMFSSRPPPRAPEFIDASCSAFCMSAMLLSHLHSPLAIRNVARAKARLTLGSCLAPWASRTARPSQSS